MIDYVLKRVKRVFFEFFRVEQVCQIDALISHKKSPLDRQSRWVVPGEVSAEKRGESKGRLFG